MSNQEQKPEANEADVQELIVQQLRERAQRGKKRLGSNALDVNLHLAALRGDTALMHSAIAKGADVNYYGLGENSNSTLRAAIRHAIHCDTWEPVQILLDAGAIIGFEDALWLGKIDLVGGFLKEGYKPDTTFTGGRTPLHIVAHRGFLELVDLLLELGVSPDAQDSQGRTPLFFAYVHRHPEVVSRLREAGAEMGIMEASLLGETTLVLSFLDSGVDIETFNGAEMTPLMAACVGGHLELARLLLDRGADLNAQSLRIGKTPALCATEYNHVALLELLVEKGLDVHAPIHHKGETQTLLQTASVSRKCLDVLHYLLSQGVDVDEKGLLHDSMLCTPLHTACLMGHREVARLLLDAGADIEAKDRYDTTPLGTATMSLCFDINLVKLLIARGADVNARGTGITPLRHAIYNANIDLLKVLIAAGADVHEVDNRGKNILSDAMMFGNDEIIQILRAHGLRMSLRTRISRMLTKVTAHV